MHVDPRLSKELSIPRSPAAGRARAALAEAWPCLLGSRGKKARTGLRAPAILPEALTQFKERGAGRGSAGSDTRPGPLPCATVSWAALTLMRTSWGLRCPEGRCSRHAHESLGLRVKATCPRLSSATGPTKPTEPGHKSSTPVAFTLPPQTQAEDSTAPNPRLCVSRPFHHPPLTLGFFRHDLRLGHKHRGQNTAPS